MSVMKTPMVVLGVIAAWVVVGTGRADLPARDTFQVSFDGGTCVVKKNAWPSVGSGCHVHYEERAQDGTIVESVVVLECGQFFDVCGEKIRCNCTPTPMYR